MERENFGSRLGFILVSAGCAIGIGNVWKFPYVAGQNGGGIFVLFYLLFLFIMGAPILSMELAMGRASRKGAIKAYKSLEPKKSKWHIHGYICILGSLLLMMYYTTVSGWMLNYAFKFAIGKFNNVSTDGVENVFNTMLNSPAQMLIFMAISVIVGIIVCSFGLQNGIEKITKVMMLCLIALIIILAIHSFTLSNAKEGLSFYLLPNIENVKAVGLGKVITAAMNQSFFTLSIGAASMEIFGSYMSKDNGLAGESFRISVLDTFVAIMSGLIIFPACFSYNVETTAGPSLIFITLPKVFINMPYGRIWGSLFFIFMTFASFSTVIAVFENLIASGMENLNISRTKSSVIHLVILLVTSIPCALSFSLLKNVTLIKGMGILDSEDFLVSNLILPIGALIILIFCVTKWGWGFDNYLEEANTGKGVKIPKWTKYYFRFVLPILIIIIIIQGLI
ncbi:sodium-dependent transporter [Lachnospira pectinoschiza]|uniref:Transporter n=1 Tax=Lachnospira pectinoschiza TaxID=28052 RepID=A0A1G9VAJ5_9FIRM|nr:sodium-dependent transporter [Lachnospira pectinoschiza]SDM68875.1 neurotransmitter:Na+ symporter, NSS family [Lachnospira pectinoschiza]